MAIRPFRPSGDPVLSLDGRLYLDVLRGETRRRALRAVRTADWATPVR